MPSARSASRFGRRLKRSAWKACNHPVGYHLHEDKKVKGKERERGRGRKEKREQPVVTVVEQTKVGS